MIFISANEQFLLRVESRATITLTLSTSGKKNDIGIALFVAKSQGPHPIVLAPPDIVSESIFEYEQNSGRIVFIHIWVIRFLTVFSVSMSVPVEPNVNYIVCPCWTNDGGASFVGEFALKVSAGKIERTKRLLTREVQVLHHLNLCGYFNPPSLY